MADSYVSAEIARQLGRELLADAAAEWEKDRPDYPQMAGRLEAQLQILLDALDAEDARRRALLGEDSTQ